MGEDRPTDFPQTRRQASRHVWSAHAWLHEPAHPETRARRQHGQRGVRALEREGRVAGRAGEVASQAGGRFIPQASSHLEHLPQDSGGIGGRRGRSRRLAARRPSQATHTHPAVVASRSTRSPLPTGSAAISVTRPLGRRCRCARRRRRWGLPGDVVDDESAPIPRAAALAPNTSARSTVAKPAASP